jgi:hypothetical protein
MDQVSGTNSTNPIANVDWSSGEGLSAEGILAYCSSRLSVLDGMIESRFAEQKKRGQALKEAGEVLAYLSQFDHISDKGGNNDVGHKNIGADLLSFYDNCTDPKVKAKISEAFTKMTGGQLILGSDGKATSSLGVDPADAGSGQRALPLLCKDKIGAHNEAQWSGFLGGIKTMQDGISKDSELSMIQMQSIVSQRQLAVQMTTQLMQAKNESVMCVVRNIKGG